MNTEPVQIMSFDEFRKLFLQYNPLGHVWVNQDDNICIQAHSCAKVEIYQGTHYHIACQLNLVSKLPF